MLSNLTFVIQCAYFSIRPKKGFVFLEQLLSNFRYKKQLLIVFEQLLGNFLRNYGKRFGKFRATCGKPYSWCSAGYSSDRSQSHLLPLETPRNEAEPFMNET